MSNQWLTDASHPQETPNILQDCSQANTGVQPLFGGWSVRVRDITSCAWTVQYVHAPDTVNACFTLDSAVRARSWHCKRMVHLDSAVRARSWHCKRMFLSDAYSWKQHITHAPYILHPDRDRTNVSMREPERDWRSWRSQKTEHMRALPTKEWLDNSALSSIRRKRQ